MDCAAVEFYANWATIIGVPIGVLSLLGVFWHLILQKNQHNKEWSMQYIEGYSEKEFVHCAQKAKKFLMTKEDKKFIYEHHKEDDELFRSVRTFFNYFESLAYLYINNIADRKMINDMVGQVSVDSYKDSKWYIEALHNEIRETNKNIKSDQLPYVFWKEMNTLIEESKTKKKTSFYQEPQPPE